MATGHYVRIDSSAEHSGEVGLSAQGSSPLTGLCGSRPSPRLLRGIDDSKDQSYFLSMTRVSHYSCFYVDVCVLPREEILHERLAPNVL
jgi:hypothetical protein